MMRNKTIYNCVALAIFCCGNTGNLNAQFLKKLKDKVAKTVSVGVETFPQKKQGQQKGDTYTKTTTEKNGSVTPKKDSKQDTKIDYSDAIIYKSPSDTFNDIVLQSHKGLIRFGGCNFYLKSGTRPDQSPEISAKRKKFQDSYRAYESLLMLNFADAYFAFMDREYLTPRPKNQNPTEKEVKSRAAQELLSNVAFFLTAEPVKRVYFCDDHKQNNCHVSKKWGGYRADEFIQNEKYVAYVSAYFEDLKKWSNQFFKDGTETVYMATRAKLNGNDYDFDHNGFWIPIPPRNNQFGMEYSSMHDQFFFEFLPQNKYGQDLLNKINDPAYYKGKVLFKIAPEKAETLVNKKLEFLYMASKVKIVFNGMGRSHPSIPVPTFTYHFESPTIEIYEGAAMTQKIGEISLEHPIYKEPE